MSTVQKWLSVIAGLGALALVVSNPKGIAAAGSAVSHLTAGAVTEIVNTSPKK